MAVLPIHCPNTLTHLVLAVGVVVVSFAVILIRLEDAPGLVTVAFRMSVATLLLSPIVAVRNHMALTSMNRRDLPLLIGQVWHWLSIFRFG